MYLWIIVSATLSAYCSAVFIDAAAVFQQCGYKTNDYFVWLNKTRKRRLAKILFSISLMAALIVLKTAFYFDLVSYAVLCGVCLYICAYIVCGGMKLRVKPKFTFRFTRIIALSFILFGALSLFIDCLGVKLFTAEIQYSAILVPLYPYFIAFSSLVLTPYEKLRFKISVVKCKKRIERKNGLIKIGITGSCGKTSVKNYLAEMLAYDYKTYITPKSFNTPLGICMAVEKMPQDTEVFIAEMGARRLGDIKFLTDMVGPQIGIITAICEQHMETFLSVENVKNAKYELIEGLRRGGTAIFSADSVGSQELYARAEIRKISAGICGENVSAESVKITGKGTAFYLKIGGVKYFAETKLLGRHNVTDICLAAAAATELGVKPTRIISAIYRLKPPPHRLELSETDSGVAIIDDGYNANIEGVKSAAEVIDEFDGEKFAVVSGIVEGGDQTRVLNEEVGRILKNSADSLIAVGAYSDHIARGARGGKCKVVKFADLSGAKDYLKGKVKRGDVVVFINDLPDRYL